MGAHEGQTEPHLGFQMAVYDPPFNPVNQMSGQPLSISLVELKVKVPKREVTCEVTDFEVKDPHRPRAYC